MKKYILTTIALTSLISGYILRNNPEPGVPTMLMIGVPGLCILMIVGLADNGHKDGGETE